MCSAFSDQDEIVDGLACLYDKIAWFVHIAFELSNDLHHEASRCFEVVEVVSEEKMKGSVLLGKDALGQTILQILR